MKYSKLHQVKKISNEPKIITQSLLKIKNVLDILYWFLFKRNISHQDILKFHEKWTYIWRFNNWQNVVTDNCSNP